MTVIVGSARIDERGKASGGSNKNNAEKEVSRQEWYPHSKGWWVIRPNDDDVAEKIAQNMEAACDSIYIGYDQSQNNTLYNAVKPLAYEIAKLKTYCETDCARLVRVCILFAGINVGDFYTGNMKDYIMKTGKFTLFTSDDYCKSSKNLKRGDILVTRTKGHTVVVLSNGSNVSVSKPVTPTTTTKDPVSTNVKAGQKWLNNNYPEQLGLYCGALLQEDGEYGTKSRAACVCVWKDVVNRKYGASLNPKNDNFLSSSKAAAKKAQIEKGKSGTFVLIAQLILSAKGFYTGKMNAKFDDDTDAAVRAFQASRGLAVDGIVGPDTWYALFN